MERGGQEDMVELFGIDQWLVLHDEFRKKSWKRCMASGHGIPGIKAAIDIDQLKKRGFEMIPYIGAVVNGLCKIEFGACR